MTSKAPCEWCGQDGWKHAVRTDNITGLLLCGLCRGRDRLCFACRKPGHELIEDELMCKTCVIAYKEKRARSIEREFRELIGMNVQKPKLERELVRAKRRYGKGAADDR